MFITITFLLITAVLSGLLMEKIKLPALLGYLITGLCFSPYMAEILQLENSSFSPLFLTHKLNNDSAIFRVLALFIILYRAGLGLDRYGLKENGLTAINLSIIPCLLEAAAVAFCAHYLFKLPLIESSILGFVMAAVSPAVIVPMMLKLQERNIGSDKKIPTLILASSTVDDIIAISGLGICLTLLGPGAQQSWQHMALSVPIALASGAVTGYYLAKPIASIFKSSGIHPLAQVILLIGVAMLFKSFEETGKIPFSYLFATLSLGISLRMADTDLATDIALYFRYLWKVAEIALFVLIGAMVDINIAFDAGLNGLIILGAGLLARSIGVVISTCNSKLNKREILFCVLSYLPKATVQATVGGMALALFLKGKIWLYEGAATGDLIIAMAAMSILITAPLGAIATRIGSKHLLHIPPEEKQSDKESDT